MVEPFEKNRPLLLRTMNGIGDACWFLAMIARAKETLGIPKIIVKAQEAGDFRDGRALEFLRRFKFIDFVFSERFDIHASPPVSGNRIAYIPSGYNEDRSQYTLIPNPFIEWATRLEDVMPSLPVDWSFLKTKYRIDELDTKMACDLAKRGRFFGGAHKGYICLHLGAASDNRIAGMNAGGVWSARHWRELIALLRSQADVPIIVLGSDYDQSYASQVLADCSGVVSLCGKTTAGQVVEILRNASLMVSFASGLPIAAVYMGVPTLCFWNPEGRSMSATTERYWFSDAFATNWAPPRARHYQTAVYGRDDCDSVFRKIFSLFQ